MVGIIRTKKTVWEAAVRCGLVCFVVCGKAVPLHGDGLSCLDAITLPPYPLVARVARHTGTVEVTVRIGPKGAGEVTKSDGPSEPLKVFSNAIVSSAVFREECAGVTTQLRFRFKLEGRPSDSNATTVEVRAPGLVTFIAAPPVVSE